MHDTCEKCAKCITHSSTSGSKNGSGCRFVPAAGFGLLLGLALAFTVSSYLWLWPWPVSLWLCHLPESLSLSGGVLVLRGASSCCRGSAKCRLLDATCNHLSGQGTLQLLSDRASGNLDMPLRLFRYLMPASAHKKCTGSSTSDANVLKRATASADPTDIEPVEKDSAGPVDRLGCRASR